MPASSDLETLKKVLLVGPPLPDEAVWEVYEDTCVHCGGQAHSIHELIPRSLAPDNWDRARNRVLLCGRDHRWAQEGPLDKALQLRAEADELLDMPLTLC